MEATNINPTSLIKIIERFSNASVFVIGDIILDCYIWGNVERICPEAPVPVVDINHDSLMLGGAANVVENLRALGAQFSLCSIVGNDSDGASLEALLKEKGMGTEGIFVDTERFTTKKTRIVAGHQQVVRFDRETRKVISETMARKIFKHIKACWDQYDAVIISDYGKGLIHAGLMDDIRNLHRMKPKIISVDPKERNLDCYHRVSLITPNKREASIFSGKEIHTEEDLKEAGRKIMHHLQCENLVITLGSEGMILFKKDGRCLKIPTFAREVFDVSGAGDTAVSTLTLALVSGASLAESVIIANYAAGVVVGKIGTASVSSEELKKYIWDEKKRVSPKNLIAESLTPPVLNC